jgi:hypothetical protein
LLSEHKATVKSYVVELGDRGVFDEDVPGEVLEEVDVKAAFQNRSISEGVLPPARLSPHPSRAERCRNNFQASSASAYQLSHKHTPSTDLKTETQARGDESTSTGLWLT